MSGEYKAFIHALARTANELHLLVTYLRVRSINILRAFTKYIRPLLPPLNFITLHYAYFIGVCLITSVIFWGASTPSRSISYTDSLFFTVSAMTLAGLNTVNLSTLNTFQQALLFALIILGSAILVSSAVVHIRRKAFEAKFEKIVSEKRRRKRSQSSSIMNGRLPIPLSLSRQGTVAKDAEIRHTVPQGPGPFRRVSLSRPHSRSSIAQEQKLLPEDSQTQPQRDQISPALPTVQSSDVRPRISDNDENGHVIFSIDTKSPPQGRPSGDQLSPQQRMLPPQRIGADTDAVSRDKSWRKSSTSEERGRIKNTNGELYASFRIGRNSTFHDLTEAQREELGGVEYRAITFLSIVVPIYFTLWQLLGCLGVGAYIARNKASVSEENGINPWWTGSFFAVSAFNNSGMSLLDANMMPFQSSYFMLITMGLLILAGNTCYPIFLRFIIWVLRISLPDGEHYRDYRDTLEFLLDHPRRCYTNLFPSAHTWWLLLSVLVLNGIDWVAFEVLNIGNPALRDIPAGSRAIDGLFQAFAVRSGGFYIIGISSLRIGLQVLYVVMMYISVYPVVITMRNSNVYEERSLGIYSDDTGEDQEQLSFLRGLRKSLPASPPSQKRYFMQQQLRAQLAHDLWWIVLAVIFITIVETSQFERDPVTYSVFNVIFETISAYGCVGISTGLPDQMYSFSGGWHKLSKLILCAVMIRGRHRGLPVAIDRAILLPGEHLAAAEEEDAQIRMERPLMISRSRSEAV
ncbi:hypothetical protein FGG08_002984 [Glutinoglossum americanum]|uniref:Potassium transport protein n=1 Tax=Glutinoglossum americanum TaxID=1670608 RepID=A0A9P8KYN5_9PEZI|nr:hypothetical protein FGG08_002984 [Glutinoglossum americanum]